jgi:hypothetical protein
VRNIDINIGITDIINRINDNINCFSDISNCNIDINYFVWFDDISNSNCDIKNSICDISKSWVLLISLIRGNRTDLFKMYAPLWGMRAPVSLLFTSGVVRHFWTRCKHTQSRMRTLLQGEKSVTASQTCRFSDITNSCTFYDITNSNCDISNWISDISKSCELLIS